MHEDSVELSLVRLVTSGSDSLMRGLQSLSHSRQLIIRDTAKVIDEFMNKFLGTEDEVYSFYTDTDSCYLTLDTMVEKHLKGKSRDEIIDILDKFVDQKLEPIINGRMQNLVIT